MAGILAALAIVALLLYFFVVKERRRTAIERSLRMSKRQCRVSILARVMVLTVIAASLGSLCGGMTLEKTQETNVELESTDIDQYTYDTRYSLWAKNRELAEKVEIEVETPKTLGFAIPVALLVLIWVLATALLEKNLRIDPIYLLGSKE